MSFEDTLFLSFEIVQPIIKNLKECHLLLQCFTHCPQFELTPYIARRVRFARPLKFSERRIRAYRQMYSA